MHIIVAEDDEETADLITRVLQDEGHQVVTVNSGAIARNRLLSERFDLAVLDRMLPDVDGMAIMRQAREANITTLILMVTALGSISNRVEGLEAGADDYLTKPFAMTELVARVHALQRRITKEADAITLACGPLHMNIMRRELRFNDRPVPLQPRELRLLEEVMRGDGGVVTRAMLLQNVWGFHFEPQTNLVETHMSRLRSKLAMAGAKDVIKTVRGLGYRLTIVN